MSITLEIPDSFYRRLSALRALANKRHDRTYIYHGYRTIIDQLTTWLYGRAEGPYKLVECDTDVGKVVLESDPDNPFACYWTLGVCEKISDHFRFGGLWEQAQTDP